MEAQDQTLKAEFVRIADEAQKSVNLLKEELKGAIDKKADPETIAQLKAELQADTQTLKESMETIGMEMTALKERGANPVKTYDEELNDTLKANAENFLKVQKGEFPGKLNLTVKAAGTMATTNIVPSVSTAIPYSLVDGDGGITRIQRRRPFLRQILNARPVSSMYVWWAEQANVDGGVDTVAEGAAKPKVDFDIVERTAKVEKIAGHAKTSKEVLADVQGIRNFIDEELRQLVELKFDEQLMSGNGTSPNLKGLLSWAQTASVASTPFATAGTGVNMANNWDVLTAVSAVMSANSFFEPDTYILNPMDWALMSMVKTTDGVYIQHPLATAAGQAAAGVRVVTNPLVTAGTFVVLDSTRVSLRIREEFNISVGYENDDFTKNLVTIVGEMRGLLYVKTNYAGAVVKGTFATVAAAMETA